MSFPATLVASRPALASFAAMGVLWGSYAATLPDIKTMLGVDEAGLGLLILGAPIAAVLAMLLAPATGVALGRFALPLASLAMALAFMLPGQAPVAGGLMLVAFAAAMALCGATTGTLDVLMNARVAAMENARGHSLMNLCHAAYSLGYAGSALISGGLRAGAWGPGQVMLVAAFLALALGLASYEADGRIDGLAKPMDANAAGLGRVAVIGGAIVLILFVRECRRKLVCAACRTNAGRQPGPRRAGPCGDGADHGGGATGRPRRDCTGQPAAPDDHRRGGGRLGRNDRGFGCKPGDGLCRVHRFGYWRVGRGPDRLYAGRANGAARGTGARCGTGHAAGLFRLFLRPADDRLYRRQLWAAGGVWLYRRSIAGGGGTGPAAAQSGLIKGRGYSTQSPSNPLGINRLCRPRSLIDRSPTSPIVVINSFWITSSALVTPASPIAPKPLTKARPI